MRSAVRIKNGGTERGSWTTCRASLKVPRNRRSVARVVGLDKRAGQKTHSPFLLSDRGKLNSNRAVHLGPFGRLPPLQRLLQPLLVVKSQERGLPCRAQSAARQGMVRIPFELDRSAISVFDQHPAAGTTAAARRRVIVRPARDDPLRCDEIGNGILHGGALAAGQCRSRKGKPRQLQKIAPAGRAATPALGRLNVARLVVSVVDEIDARAVLVHAFSGAEVVIRHTPAPG